MAQDESDSATLISEREVILETEARGLTEAVGQGWQLCYVTLRRLHI
jgi:hypothetical protein